MKEPRRAPCGHVAAQDGRCEWGPGCSHPSNYMCCACGTTDPNRHRKGCQVVEVGPLPQAPEYKGTHCPTCGSDHIEGEGVVVGHEDHGERFGGKHYDATQCIKCLDCDATWTDFYALMGYADLME